MVLFLSVALGVSVIGMISILTAKRYELATGKVFLRSARPTVGGFFHTLTWLTATALPGKVRAYARSAWQAFITWLHRAIAKGVLMFEHTLERVLHAVRENTSSERSAGEASAFLREVADHKKSLLKKSDSHAIFEE